MSALDQVKPVTIKNVAIEWCLHYAWDLPSGTASQTKAQNISECSCETDVQAANCDLRNMNQT